MGIYKLAYFPPAFHYSASELRLTEMFALLAQGLLVLL